MDGNEMIIIDRLARIEVKLDEALQGYQDHEIRLRSLERWKYALPASLFIALASAGATIVQFVGK